MKTYRFTQGDTPVLMSIPHGGTALPGGLAGRLSPQARTLPDTDWHLDRLYDFAGALGISTLAADYSRYAIDLNRSPDGKPLYPGASNSELVPLTTFAEAPIYGSDDAPDAEEIAQRRTEFWEPYHAHLAASLAGIKRRHGFAALFDCHSIRSTVPRFFDGQLPDFNLGTADGAACDATLRKGLSDALAGFDAYSLAVDARFKGGYITRHYGNPTAGIHAIQLELAQHIYMDEDPPFSYREDRATRLQPVLRQIFEMLLAWTPV